jgi:hypothetical protein
MASLAAPPPGGPAEQFLYTSVYVNDAGAWLLATWLLTGPGSSAGEPL